MSEKISPRDMEKESKNTREHVGKKKPLLLKDAKVGSVVTVVVAGPGPRRAQEEVKIRAITEEHIFVEGLKLPFDRSDGIQKKKLVNGMMVKLNREIVSL